MEKSANELVQESLVAAVLDAVVAWKAASGGLANALARDLGSVHANTTLADLPKEVQASLRESTRAAFNRLLKEGYTVSKGAPPPSRPPPTGTRPPRPEGLPRRDAPPRGPRGPGKPPGGERKGGGGGRGGGPARGR
ncbi:MAG: hypothetical protein ACKVOP_02065 [Sphingomonadaceae bacterium]